MSTEPSVFRARIADSPVRELRNGRGISRQLLHPDLSGISEIDLHINELNPRSGPGPSHFHEASLNIYLVLEGSIRVVLPEGPVVLGAGELLSISPGVVHETSNPGEETARFVEIYLPAGDDFHIVGTQDG